MECQDTITLGPVTYEITRKFVGDKRPKEVILEKILTYQIKNRPLDEQPSHVV